MPVLELDDGTRLTEGPAIVQWIADLVPEKKLAPPNGTPQRTELQRWLNFISTELHKGFSPLARGNWIYRYLTARWPDALHRRFA